MAEIKIDVLTLLFTGVISGAVISALINLGWNAYVKAGDRNRVSEKEAHVVGHVYLEIVIQLERFARKCNGRLYDISTGLDMYRDQHDNSGLNDLPAILFLFDPEPDWTALPVQFVAELKSIADRYEQCSSWIAEQYLQWADYDDAYELEEGRLAYYGLEACKLVSEIRIQIDAGDGELEDLVRHFRSTISARRAFYEKNPSDVYSLIPELRGYFERMSEPPAVPL